MPLAFISHRTADRDFIEVELLPLLDQFGITPWYCKLDIDAGHVWEREIYKALCDCDWFLLVLSPRAVGSDWIHREVSFAFAHREGRIIPVLMEAVSSEAIHIGLPTLQHVDFTKADRTEARLQLLERFGIQATAQDLPTVVAPVVPLPPRAPVDPAGIEIKRVQIEPLNPTGAPVLAPQVEPPLPEEVLEVEGLLACLTETITRIAEGSHPILQPGKLALAEARQRWQLLHEDLNAHRPQIDESSRCLIEEKVLANDPDTPIEKVHAPLRLLAPLAAEAYFHRARNVARARRAWEDGLKKYEAEREKAVARLQKRSREVALKLESLQEQDLKELLETLIRPCSTPEELEGSWSRLVLLLAQRRYRIPLPDHAHECAWWEAQHLRTVGALGDFLKAYPSSPHAAEVQRLLTLERKKQQRDEAEAWKVARQRNTVETWEDFLRQYPDTPQVEKVRQGLAAYWRKGPRNNSSALLGL
jgi:hypothetical protein